MTKNNKLASLIIICTTIVLVMGICAWVYVQHQAIAQKDRELQQQKQLTEYEQEQLNNRNERDNKTKECTAAKENSTSTFGSMYACRE